MRALSDDVEAINGLPVAVVDDDEIENGELRGQIRIDIAQ